MRAALRISVMALVLGARSVALAQEGSSEPTPAQVRVAAEAFDKGREAYKAEDFVEAAEQFERADNNAPSPAAIELAVRSRDKAGDLDRAATLASLGVKRHPDDPNLQRLAGDLAKRARPTLFELTATCDQPCDLTINGKLVHGSPDTQRTLYIAPGALTVRAGWSDNRSDSKQVQAQAGAQGQLAFAAPPLPAPGVTQELTGAVDPQPTTPTSARADEGVAGKSGGWSPTVVYVGAGLTAVLAGVTVWSGIDTVNNPGADRVKQECAERMQREDCDLYKEGLGKQRRTNVLIGVTAGVGLGTALIALLATNWSHGSSKDSAATRLRPRVDVAPYAGLDGGGLQAVGRF
jgi:hypothetical protein